MPVYPGSGNTFVRNFEASGRLKIEFSRNPKSFALPQYAAMRKVSKIGGYWLKLGNSQASRIVSQNKYKWADGASAPDAGEELEGFSFKAFECERYAFPFHVGTRSSEQADWDLVPWLSRTMAQKAMTNRTKDAMTELLTAANWTTFSGASNTDTATNLGGGKWDVATFANNYIQKTFHTVQQKIQEQTQGAVAPGSCYCLIPPNVAKQMSESEEIRDFVKQQASSPVLQQGKEFVRMYGIPPVLHGFRMIVDDTVLTTSQKGATDARGFVQTSTTAIFGCNTVDVDKGELPPGEGVPIYDTITLFMYEDMTVEQREDVENRRTLGRVVDDFDAIVTCPESGYLVTAVVD